MGTEGAESADTAVVRHQRRTHPGPRLRISGNAVDILGGTRSYPLQSRRPRSSNATYANSSADSSKSSPATQRGSRFHQDLPDRP